VIKKYHVHSGIRRSHKIRSFFTGFACVALVSIMAIAVFNITAKITNENGATASQKADWLSTETTQQPNITTVLPWPAYGQAAYGVPEIDQFETSQESKEPVPIASLAKVITALAILEEKPLKPTEQGPLLTITERDSALFNEYLSKNGVVVPVEVGESISQYKALQATLLVSANNMSDSLAIWAFGSMENYIDYANKMLTKKGLQNTTVADASGFSPNTVSTPEDMTKIGYLYMKNPVLREIALQEQAEIPVAGIIKNANSFANENGIVGIKIGNTDEAGRTYMAAKIRPGNNSPEEISIAVVLGADNLAIAAKDAVAVLKAGAKTPPKKP